MQKLELKKLKLMIFLDALLDTRAAVLHSFGTETFLKALEEGYVSRPCDEFPGVDKEEFKKRYEARDRATLKNAIVTGNQLILKYFAEQTRSMAMTSPFAHEPCVVINIYPYELEHSEINIIRLMVASLINNQALVEVVRMSYEELTPRYLKENIKGVVMYDYWTWLDCHAKNENWKDTVCNEVDLIGPRLFKSLEAYRMPDAIKKMDSVEDFVRPFIYLQLYPVEMFSIDFSRYKKKGK